MHSQAFCAACWAFSAVGAVEGANAIQVSTVSAQQQVFLIGSVLESLYYQARDHETDLIFLSGLTYH